MPCNNADYGPHSPGLSASDVRDVVRDELKRGGVGRNDRADVVTRYLCGVLTALQRQGKDAAFIDLCEKTTDGVQPGEMQEWWSRHQTQDQR